jgi:hypothetical protein
MVSEGATNAEGVELPNVCGEVIESVCGAAGFQTSRPDVRSSCGGRCGSVISAVNRSVGDVLSW